MNFIYFFVIVIFRFYKENLKILKNILERYTFFIYKSIYLIERHTYFDIIPVIWQ